MFSSKHKIFHLEINGDLGFSELSKFQNYWFSKIRKNIFKKVFFEKLFYFPKINDTQDSSPLVGFRIRQPISLLSVFQNSVRGSVAYPWYLIHIWANGPLKKFLEDSRFRRKNHVPNFGSTEKIFFGKVGNFFDHQGRSKICLRIEWKHSQPLKSSLRSPSTWVTFFLS